MDVATKSPIASATIVLLPVIMAGFLLFVVEVDSFVESPLCFACIVTTFEGAPVNFRSET
jgi:hypothetical protein